jgi:hypothetical protein
MTSEIDGYVERMCFANSMRDAVISGEFSFLESRTLRGGAGQFKERRSWLLESVEGLVSARMGVLKLSRTMVSRTNAIRKLSNAAELPPNGRCGEASRGSKCPN